MAARGHFVLGDRAAVALAVATAMGAWRGGGPGLLAGVAVLLAGAVAHRPAVLAIGLALLAAGLADRALAGLDHVVAGPVAGWATLVGDPEPVDGGGVRVDLRIDGHRLEASAFGAAAAALEDRLAGERVLVDGRQRPPPEDAPWLVPRRVVGRLSIDAVDDVATGSPAATAANGLRRTLAAGAEGLSPTARSLLAGVVLGDGREQPPELTDDFQAAGLAHLLVVSGQNVAFVLLAAGPVLTRLRWRTRFPLTLLVLACFALLVRFEPSVLRAVAMAAVATLASATGRPTEGTRVLAVAVTALLLIDPLLVRSVGFGLSVSASAAILVLGPRIRTAIGGPRWLAEPLAVTVAAQVGTAPLLLATFGPLPVAAVPANLLAVPAAAPLMVWGLTAGVVAGVLPPGVATVVHLPTSVLTWWLAGVARWAAGLPLGELRAMHVAALAAAALLWMLLRSRPVLAVAVAAVLIVAAVGRPRLGPGPTGVGEAGTLWADGRVRVLVLDGAGPADRALESLRQVGARCVDVIAYDGGGPGTVALAAALLRRCPGAVAVAAEGDARPGWLALPEGSSATIGPFVLTAGAGLVVRSVGSAGDDRGPP